ncbi:non-specific lipid-transfer protein-like protein [Panicum miliaceum]|uniref:Non-specific lipid-transfer protein-like protein n=1 Tax=Panicum miliaceum TaxID=4540 RepID=A0A3L6THF9_PANMI|nr:non-specific lipid-transfer protein-like protein [Panicum miliaceum]
MAAARTTAMVRLPCLLALTVAALLAATARVDGATGTAAPAPAPSADCTNALLSLAGCLSYVQEGSTVATPDPTCCSGLRDVVRGEVACLCQVFQGGQNLGISLNMTKALQLPAACKVKTPPVSKCHVSVPGVPTASPVPAPSAGAPFFSQSPSSPAPSGSPAAEGTGIASSTPAPSPARSGAASLSSSSQSFFTAAAAAAALFVFRVL